jgi:CTP synthase (UTP-ammonia lyase)
MMTPPDVNPVSTVLDERLRAFKFGDTRIFVLLGHPRSSLGKGNLIARLARIAGGPVTIIKYDGILNTNVSNNHPSPVDDLATYRRFNDGITMGWPNQILGGEVLAGFIAEFGGTDYEQLTFVPHVSKYLLTRLHEAWQAAGAAPSLFVELGGTAGDLEVTSYVLPAVALLARLTGRVRLMLLTEVARDGTDVRTRVALEGMRGVLAHGLVPDAVFVREPAGGCALERDGLAAFVQDKIARAAVYGGHAPPVVAIPNFAGPGLEGYLEYLGERRDRLPWL